MRFRTKFDRWLMLLLVPGALLSLGGPLLAPGISPWVVALTWGGWATALAAMLPQYYELRPDGLYIRQGWRRRLIPYQALVEVRPVTDSRSAAVFSLDRVEVVTDGCGHWLIAPAEQRRFLEELARLAPRLASRGFALALPFSTF
jgi:hypothetical protein